LKAISDAPTASRLRADNRTTRPLGFEMLIRLKTCSKS
jgi:hypothetical protein